MATRVLRGRTSGDQLIILIDTGESRGEVFRFEYVARSMSPSPRDHVHKDQEERLEVLEGKISCRIAGIERELEPGEALTIHPGVPHAAWSADPRGSRSTGEFRPAKNTQAVFERSFS